MTHADIIELWPSHAALASDLGPTYTIPMIKMWSHRKRIPGDYWPDVLRAAANRGYSVTLDSLQSAAPARKRAHKEAA